MTTLSDHRRPKKWYLAGPMRGYDQFNFPAFDAAAQELRWYGYEVISPAEIDRALGFDEKSNDLTKFDELGGIEAAMHRDFGAILECDGVVLLPGWRSSAGSRAEVFVAQTTGRVVREYVAHDGGGFHLDKVETGVELPAPPAPATVIGLAGYAQVGKDTVANLLVEDYGFERLAFADALRDMLYALDPMIPHHHNTNEQYAYSRLAALVDAYGWDEVKVRFPEVRALLQRLGTEAGREVLGQNIWVRTAMANVKPGGRYVFTDCRFPNEAEAVKAAGGSIVRVSRTGYAPVNAHPSETALDDWPFDFDLFNQGTSLTQLGVLVDFLVADLGLRA